MTERAKETGAGQHSTYDRLRRFDTAPSAELDALTKAAALVCGTPISLITLLNEDTQWFKANYGLEGVEETARDVSFCTHALEGRQLMEVEDATQDSRFAENPFVTDGIGVRFYAGVPLELSDGERVGTLCVIDQKPKTLSQNQRDILSHLARAAAKALEARLMALRERELQAVEAEARSILENSPDAILTMDNDGTIRHWNDAAERLFGYLAAEAVGRPLSLIVAPEHRDAQTNLAERLGDISANRNLRTERVHKNGTRLAVSVSLGPVVSDSGAVTGATEIIRDIGDVVKTHRELEAAERQIERLYRATPAMLHSTDPSGTLLSVSDRWLDVMKYNREEVIGRKLADFLTPESARISRTEVLPAFLFDGHCENVRYQMVTRSGQVLDVLLSAILERDGAGNPLRIISTIEDVTQRRKAENALIEERRRLQQIIEATRSGTWEWNAQTDEFRLNHLWARIIGYEREELGSPNIRTWQDRIHPDDLALHEGQLAAHLRGETESYDCEMRLRHKSGDWIWVAGRGRALTWTESGKPEWVFGTLQDVTRQKDEEEELRQNREFLERTGNLAGVGGWEVDLETAKVYWSEETCRIHGVASDFEPSLEKVVSFFDPEVRETFETSLRSSIENGTSWDMELPMTRGDGRRIWLRVNGSVQFEDGRPVRLLGASQDVTQQVLQRLELERVNERMAIATENGRIGVWDANLASGKTYYSDIWCGLIGYRRNEIADSGDHWLDYIHPDDVERARTADADHIRGEAPFFEEEFRMRHKDGRWIWILDRGRVVQRAEDGSPMRMIGTHTDITARKRAEEERFLMSERMTIATDSGGIGIWEMEIDRRVAHWDALMYRLYGLDASGEDDIGDIWRRAVHPEDRERVEKAVHRTIETGDHLDEEYRVMLSDGAYRHLHIAANLVRDKSGRPSRVIGAAWDVTARRQMTLDLAEQHELMRVTLNSIGDAVITTDAAGRVRWLNPAAERMTGWSADEAAGKPSAQVFSIINEETREIAPDPIAASLEHGRVVGLAENTLLVGRHGLEYGIEDSAAPIRSSEGQILGVVLVFHDVSEQRRLSREMTYRASHDPLTGLLNRSEFDRRLQRTFETAQEAGTANVLLYIDLDQFKIVNDTCGHTVGDALLKKVSSLMQDCLRKRDTLARLGGDEFAVLLEHCSPADGERIAQKICDRMSEFRFVHDEKHFRVGTSIGLVPIDRRSTSVSAILQAADTSCYVAKERGRNRVHAWEESDETLKMRSGETRWASRIERALQEESFVLYAQAIAPIDGDGSIRHIELLLRMVDDNGEIVLPGAFMPAAERFNLVSHIDRWVLAKALEKIASSGLSSERARLCVNLSGKSLGDRAFHKMALDLLDEAGSETCHCLCIEITETAVITNMEEASSFIENLRHRGISVALDDFGAGSSSFGYLKHFALDYLKIDGQFIRELLSDPLNEATIKCFVEVARVLGVETIAEYVGDEPTCAKLKDYGVDFAQGFYIHEPEPIADLLHRLELARADDPVG
ncbi:PAS domain S-box protein [Martelella radicis]|uniref:Diguanylate cyclase (GGDEF)-like protein/PAS domain S-box-containing protein n=1 Tax=Martelella radicis TaxID=1397476 RepID=A0A7W6KFT3_9HYPH|nr:PAS domain S-box protein [Martelella radicis]MBB4120285.1 diguanylate cyclase (GGDEF)-like protein/PAS domain S-box-containing protein [Martelella radicis]